MMMKDVIAEADLLGRLTNHVSKQIEQLYGETAPFVVAISKPLGEKRYGVHHILSNIPREQVEEYLDRVMKVCSEQQPEMIPVDDV